MRSLDYLADSDLFLDYHQFAGNYSNKETCDKKHNPSASREVCDIYIAMLEVCASQK